MDSDGEILRLRSRVHELFAQTQALGLLSREIVTRLERIEPQVNALARKDEIAEAVAERLSGERHLYLTVAQKLGVAIVGSAAVSDAILRATGH